MYKINNNLHHKPRRILFGYIILSEYKLSITSVLTFLYIFDLWILKKGFRQLHQYNPRSSNTRTGCETLFDHLTKTQHKLWISQTGLSSDWKQPWYKLTISYSKAWCFHWKTPGDNAWHRIKVPPAESDAPEGTQDWQTTQTHAFFDFAVSE